MNTERIRELAKQAYLDWHKNWNDDGRNRLEKFAALVAAEEREACAKVCEEPYDLIQITDDCSEYVYKDHLVCAAAIRARGNE
jgi:hypothetical protein